MVPVTDHTATFSNLEAAHDCAMRVAGQLCGGDTTVSNVTLGSLATNTFSFTFPIEVKIPHGSQSVFVKIPKTDMREKSYTILPISDADRRMAEEEIKSLGIMRDSWRADDLNVFWVRFLGTVPEYNAIVTGRIHAREALEEFRKFDMRRRFGSPEAGARLRDAMARLGAALGRFHQSQARVMKFSVRAALPKLKRYRDELSHVDASSCLTRLNEKLEEISSLEIETLEVPTLKGIDIRNVLIDDKDALYFLDPGKMKAAPREADLARFLMTYRILYWGSKRLIFGLLPDEEAENAFLRAYYANSSPGSSQLLGFYFIKEQLKHWHTAIDSLQKLSWPRPLKRVAVSSYVNPFYRRQMMGELKKV